MAKSSTETAVSAWKGLYRVGGAAALIAVVFFRRFSGAELDALGGFGVFFGIFNVPDTIPSRALDWFALLQRERLVGLVLFGLVDLVNYVLVGLLFLALYGALRRVNKGIMVMATSLALVGVAVYSASNQAFSMLALSQQYAAATTDAQRATFLAAGEALLAGHNPSAIYQGTGIHMSLLLVTLAGLIISIVMLRSGVFGKATAYAGILANALVLGHFIALTLTPAQVALVAFPVVASAPFRITWYVLAAVRLFRLASGALEEAQISGT